MRSLILGNRVLDPPNGSSANAGETELREAKITVIDYDETRFEEKEAKAIEECFPFKDKPTVTWINIDGIHDVDVVDKIGQHFGLHPLTLEGVVNVLQRPKMEDFGDHIFVILKMVYFDEKDKELKAEHVSLIVGSNFLISFQETEGDPFNPIRARIRGGKSRIRKAGSDYLAYALMDAVVDGYFIVLERIGEKIESLEEELVGQPGPETLEAIQHLRGELILLRQSGLPLRAVASSLERGESTLIKKPTRVYLRDVYDHVAQVVDEIEVSRDTLSTMIEIYVSSISNKLNAVMKVLTTVATIFMPLTLIASIYGMNFRNMPELGWRHGYPSVIAAMVIMTIAMVMYFKRRDWF